MKIVRSLLCFLVLNLVFVAVNARAQSSVCFAAWGGSDLNDGSSWASATADIMSCYDQLPPAGGTIYISDGGQGRPVKACTMGDPPGCGIWIMGQSDPNFAHPPAGWRRRKGTVAFRGYGGSSATIIQRTPQVSISAGSEADTRHPAIWLSGVEAVLFENLAIAYPGVAIKVSIDSNGNRNGAGGSQQIEFKNVSAQINQQPGLGPTVDVGSNTFWVWFRDFSVSGNGAEFAQIAATRGLVRSSGSVVATTTKPHPFHAEERIGIAGANDATFDGTFTVTAATRTTFSFKQAGPDAISGGGAASSDRNQAVVMDPGTGTGANIYFQDGMVTFGGIKDYAGFSGIGLTVQNLNQEDGDAPAVWIATCASPVSAEILNVQPADPVVPIPGLRVECGPQFGAGIVAQNTSVDGPATLAGGAGPGDVTVQPAVLGQSGIYGGRLTGQTDAARRGFGPVATRWHNLATQISSNWGNKTCNAAAVPTPVAAPDGTSNAARALTTACFYANSKLSLAVGDWFVAGAWVRSETKGFLGGNPLTFQCLGCKISPSAGYMHPPYGGSGEWEWVSGAFQILALGPPQTVCFYGSASSAMPTDFFAPVLMRLPAGTVTPNEVEEIATNLQSYRDDAGSGQVSLLRGEQFKADSIQVGDGPTIASGNGAPKNPAPQGSIYLRRDGVSGSTLYLFEDGAWKAKF